MKPASSMRRGAAGVLLAAAFVLPDGVVLAEVAPKPAPAPPPIGAEPAVTTASFGDWMLRCQRLGEPDKAVRVCEVSHTIQVQGQAAPIAQLAVGRVPGEAALRLTVVVPVSVSFPSSPRMSLEEKDRRDGAGLELGWKRCMPLGCVADGTVREEILKRWRASSEPGRLVFKDAAGRDIMIPVSLRGLDQAIEALAREKA